MATDAADTFGRYCRDTHPGDFIKELALYAMLEPKFAILDLRRGILQYPNRCVRWNLRMMIINQMVQFEI